MINSSSQERHKTRAESQWGAELLWGAARGEWCEEYISIQCSKIISLGLLQSERKATEGEKALGEEMVLQLSGQQHNSTARIWKNGVQKVISETVQNMT